MNNYVSESFSKYSFDERFICGIESLGVFVGKVT